VYRIPNTIRVIDSHTGGEPTRVIVEAPPELQTQSLSERRTLFSRQFNALRTGVVCEPRGSDVVVGALLCQPFQRDCDFGMLFFNNVGMLGMCVHGTIGVVATLAYLRKIKPGIIKFDTPVGTVSANLDAHGSVTVRNVLSYRYKKSISLDVPGVGLVSGDIAWGGNWFFLVERPEENYSLQNVERLTDIAWKIRQALHSGGHTGVGNAEIDHIELFGPPHEKANHSRNFVLCPGKAYDRSPCGTGTSAKLACLAADGKLAEGSDWIQESILGTKFTGRFRWLDRAKGEIAPVITGTASVNAEASLLLDERDPFCWGIR
jgi:4-hydroxyproline epimerase